MTNDTKARTRNLIIAFTFVPVAVFFALLGWGITRSDGHSGPFGINSESGQVTVENVSAPTFGTNTVNGTQIHLSELRGNVVMVDFWSSWCPPCRREAIDLAAVYMEYETKGVEFIGVAIWDHPDAVLEYIDEFSITYPNVIDAKGKIAITYGVTGIPEKFFVGPDGNLANKFIGPITRDELRSILDSILESSNVATDSGNI